MSNNYNTIKDLLDGLETKDFENLKNLIEEKLNESIMENLPDKYAFIGKTKYGQEISLPISLISCQVYEIGVVGLSIYRLYHKSCIKLIRPKCLK